MGAREPVDHPDHAAQGGVRHRRLRGPEGDRRPTPLPDVGALDRRPFKSRYGAAFYALTFLRIQPSQVRRLVVHGVPHAYGLESRRAGATSFYEIGWVDGPFVYHLTALSVDPRLPPSQAQTEEAAARWYARVHGHPAA